MPPLGTSAAEDMRQDEEDEDNPISSLEELLAMVNKARTGARTERRQPGQRQDRMQQPQARRGDGDRERKPRKCANCGKEHEQRACPHPPVSVADRPC